MSAHRLRARPWTQASHLYSIANADRDSAPSKLFYGLLGDLAFFYDMNALGNRCLGGNLRIVVVDNGMGFEMKGYYNPITESGLGAKADPYLAAAKCR